VDNFWSKVDKSGECWLWTACRHVDGYGSFNLNKKNMRAHRLSWEMENGKIPAGLCVLHRCDVRLCVRPSHLFLGTKADNTQDMIKKGRHGAPGLKLSDRDVEEMRTLRGKLDAREIAQRFGVHRSYVDMVLRGERRKEPRRVSSDGNRDTAACALVTNDAELAEKLRG
jgi:HNH endonuclease